MASDPNKNDTPRKPDAQQDEIKGKGKDTAVKNNSEVPEDTPSNGNSILSRLGRSAAGLSNSVLKGAPATDGLASFASSGKSGASLTSNQPGAWAESSSAASGSGLSGGAGGSAAFRSTQTNSHIAAEEEAFSNFLDNTSVLAQTEPLGLQESLQGAISTAPEPLSYGQARSAVASSVAEQEDRDGVEVVRLLSQENEDMPTYDGDVTISRAEMENLRRALFETGTTQMSSSDWNNMLNFVPDFLRDDGGQLQALQSSQMQLGVADTSQAGQLWLEEWNRVLTGYTDEVWGDLGDLVQEARDEIKQIKDDQKEPKTNPKALRRLRTILTHVRARL